PSTPNSRTSYHTAPVSGSRVAFAGLSGTAACALSPPATRTTAAKKHRNCTSAPDLRRKHRCGCEQRLLARGLRGRFVRELRKQVCLRPFLNLLECLGEFLEKRGRHSGR